MRVFIFLLFFTLDLYAACKQQSFIDSLDIRHYYKAVIDRQDYSEGQRILKKYHRFRASHFGRIKGEVVTYPYNQNEVSSQIVEIKFLTEKVKVHQKIAPAVKCVEHAILKECLGDNLYQPKWMSSYRSKRSYPGVISNHRFGLALDFEPMPAGTEGGNPCCGIKCGKAWRSHKVCEKHDTMVDNPFNVAKVNHCWVTAFEFYGFHWLVNSRMHDTMHFEFLGDPSLITTGTDVFQYDPNREIISKPNL